MNAGAALLLSLKPRFADAIFSGTKRFELRRVKPRLSAGDLIIAYVTVPRCKVEGAFEVSQVLAMPPRALWQAVREAAGVTKEEFDTYFEGTELGFAIEIRKVWRMAPVTLATMRRLRLRPPQSYQYLDAPTALRLWKSAAKN